MHKFSQATASLVVVLGFTAPNAAFSQDNQNDFDLEEIIVTARKVNESIQDIPLSVQAFTSDKLVRQQIIDVEDIAQFTPGLHASNNSGGRNTPSLRFRGIETGLGRNGQTNSAFLDGVYIPGLSSWVSMNDMERVEVVKGPQSAFFGRSTFSGAVNFISKTPGNEFGADVSAIVGDAGRADVWVSAEGPLIEDKLAVRAAYRYYTFDGAWENNFPGGEDLGGQETRAFNITMFATPTDNLSIKLRYVNSEEDDGPNAAFVIEGTSNNCGPFGGGDRDYFCGTLSRGLIEQGLSVDTTPPGDTRFADDLGMERDIDMTTLNIDWDINGSGYTLSSVTGAYKQDLEEYRALTERVLDLYSQWTDESLSQELRLASPQDERLRWMVGAYYLDLDFWKDGLSGFPSTGPSGPFSLGQPRGAPGLFGVNPFIAENVENKAIFGSIAFDVTEQLTVSMELRREEETLEAATSYIQEAPPLDSSTPELAISTARPFGGAEIPAKGEFKATLPRFIVDYKLTDDTLLYGSYSEGNNPGAFNPEVIQLEPTVALPNFQAVTGGIGYTVEQAELKSYEFGVKHNLASGRGIVNAAVYFMEWTNQQFRGFEPNIDSNGDGVFIQGSDRLGGGVDYQSNGSTDIFGFEVAASYAFSENWSASANYNYNKTDIQVLEDAFNGRVLGTTDASGLEVPRSPQHAAAAALNFNTPAPNMFGQQGDWFGRLDSTYQSETFTWTINRAKTEAAWMHNLRGGWRNDSYSVTAWIENLLDDDSVLAAQRSTVFNTGRLGYTLSLPQPRTVGLTFTANFR